MKDTFREAHFWLDAVRAALFHAAAAPAQTRTPYYLLRCLCLVFPDEPKQFIEARIVP